MVLRHDLVEQHLGLAQVIAMDYSNIVGISLDEAVSEAHMAMLRASDGFDPEKGDFTPYAARAIRNALNSLYAKQLKMAQLFPQSLDDPPGPTNGSTESMSASQLSRMRDSRQDVGKTVKRRETYSIMSEVLKTLSVSLRAVLQVLG